MSGELTGASQNAIAPAADPATPGELLRQAREERGISIQQAAEDLHLDVHVVDAIESNRFLELGAPVYAKGHLRKYAALLGLSPEAVIERYQRLSDTPVVPTPIPPVSPIPERPSMLLPASLVVLLILGGVAWWAFDEYEADGRVAPSSSPAVSVPVAAEDAQATQVAEPVVPPSSSPGPVAEAPAPEATVGETAAAPAVATAEPMPQEPTASEHEVQLQLEFAEPSWVEVYDGNGERLLFQVAQPGQQRTVSGPAPLQVVLGVAGAVSAHVNDEPIVVPRVAGRDSTRFRIESDGRVR